MSVTDSQKKVVGMNSESAVGLNQGLADIHIFSASPDSFDASYLSHENLEFSGIPSFDSCCSIVQPGYNRVPYPRVTAFIPFLLP